MFDLAIYYRMVGGFVGLGPNMTTWCRLRWAVTIGLYMAFAALVHHEGNMQVLLTLSGCTIGAFLGRLIPHARFQATAGLANSLGMAAVNLARLALIVVPYAYFDARRMLLVGFGALAGIAYYVGNKYLHGKDSGIYYRARSQQWRVSVAGVGQALPGEALDQCAIGGSEWGELLTGWLVYELMFVVALVIP